MSLAKYIPTLKQTLWYLVSFVSILALGVLAWLAWHSQKGPPRGPSETIALGIVIYAAAALRIGSEMAFLFLWPKVQKGALFLVGHFLTTVAILGLISTLDLRNPIKRVFACIAFSGALGTDIALLFLSRHHGRKHRDAAQIQ